MRKILPRFFRKELDLEKEIQDYLECVAEIGITLNTGVKDYLRGELSGFQQCSQFASAGERRADQILKNIKYNLYANTLYPDFQKDITQIFNKMDNVADISNQVLIQVCLETPVIPDYIKPYFSDLSDHVCKTIDELVSAAKYLFKNKTMIEDHAYKVAFYHDEANKTVEKILLHVYSDARITDLAAKRHIGYFAMKIFSVAQNAFLVAKKMVFYMIKSSAENEY